VTVDPTIRKCLFIFDGPIVLGASAILRFVGFNPLNVVVPGDIVLFL
jgi:hypothetical protein